MTARLAIVPQAPSTDDTLRDLFAAEDEAVAELARIKAQQRALRVPYARERDLMMLPSLAIIRKVLEHE